jgi:hypothetical protein
MLIPFGVLSAAGAGFDSDFELIASEILSSTQASITFSNLGDYSSTYKHLQIRMVARSNRSSVQAFPRIRLNGDTGANYAQHSLLGSGTNVQSDGATSLTQGFLGLATGANATASAFAPIVADILDPFSASKNTTIRSFCGTNEPSGNAQVRLVSTAHFSTASITSINIFDDANSWLAGSRFSLYGIKG